mmetsp:Transcript_9906/g.27955  ORF Transcript_9906/g.27955 Transcript_9906/m.27955 type:complete len:241 (+) Transcript_9906:1060-1782(+)
MPPRRSRSSTSSMGSTGQADASRARASGESGTLAAPVTEQETRTVASPYWARRQQHLQHQAWGCIASVATVQPATEDGAHLAVFRQCLALTPRPQIPLHLLLRMLALCRPVPCTGLCHTCQLRRCGMSLCHHCLVPVVLMARPRVRHLSRTWGRCCRLPSQPASPAASRAASWAAPARRPTAWSTRASACPARPTRCTRCSACWGHRCHLRAPCRHCRRGRSHAPMAPRHRTWRIWGQHQ